MLKNIHLQELCPWWSHGYFARRDVGYASVYAVDGWLRDGGADGQVRETFAYSGCSAVSELD